MKVILSVPDEGYSECTWWRLFQKRVVRTKINVYVFTTSTRENWLNQIKPNMAGIAIKVSLFKMCLTTPSSIQDSGRY